MSYSLTRPKILNCANEVSWFEFEWVDDQSKVLEHNDLQETLLAAEIRC